MSHKEKALRKHKIEHYGYLIAYIGLLAVIIVQNILAVLTNKPSSSTGEVIVFVAMTLYYLIASAYEGLLDQEIRPHLKGYVMTFGCGALLISLIFTMILYLYYVKLKWAIGFGFFIFLILIGLMVLFFNGICKEKELS